MTNRLARNLLRIIAGAVIMCVAIFRLIIPYITTDGAIYIDRNDGYVILGCVVVLLSIEVVRKVIDKRLSKYAEEENKEQPKSEV